MKTNHLTPKSAAPQAASPLAPRGAQWHYAIQLWRDWLDQEAPQLDRWLAKSFRAHPAFGKKDRQFYSEFLFSAVRFGTLAAFCEWMTPATGASTQWDLDSLLKDFRKAFPDSQSLFDLWRKINPEKFLSRILMRVNAGCVGPTIVETDRVFRYLEPRLATSHRVADQLMWAGIPLFWQAGIEARFPTPGAWVGAQVARPPLWLRLNHPDQKDVVLKELREKKFSIASTPLSEMALAVEGPESLYVLESFKAGHFEIQDLASQAIGDALDVHPGQFVWDACAGGGGKTLQIASRLQAKGALYASDIRGYKLDDLRDRVRRADFHNVRVFEWDGEAPPELEKEIALRGGFHRVLVDAPCSASGTWRRNPDGKLRFADSESIQKLTELQLKILMQASLRVRVGGKLVYGTCSFLKEENEDVVEAFLKQSALASGPQFALRNSQLMAPPQSDSDTTFAAVFERVS